MKSGENTDSLLRRNNNGEWHRGILRNEGEQIVTRHNTEWERTVAIRCQNSTTFSRISDIRKRKHMI